MGMTLPGAAWGQQVLSQLCAAVIQDAWHHAVHCIIFVDSGHLYFSFSPFFQPTLEEDKLIAHWGH